MSKKFFNIFINNYSTIRQMLHQLFVFGCYDREQSALHQKISDSKYSNEIKRIHCFWQDKISKSKMDSGKFINEFPFSRYSSDKNYLWISHCIKTFSPQDLNLYIFLLQIFDDKEYRTISEVTEKMFEFLEPSENLTNDDSDKDIFRMNRIIRDRLEDMKKTGFLELKIKPTAYRLAPDIMKKLTRSELLRLNNLLFLYRDIAPMSSLSYNLQWLIEKQRQIILSEQPQKNSLFMTEDVFFQNILNDEILYKLLTAIEEQHLIDLKFSYEEKSLDKIIPIKIIFDLQYGRQFLFALSTNKGFFIRRLENIIDVKILENRFKRSDYSDCESILNNVWCAALNFSNKKEKKIDVEIDFKITENSEYHILRRLEAEKNFGQIQEIDDKHFLFKVELIDPQELIPWIRSFGKYAKVRPSKEHNLTERLEKNYDDMILAYNDFEKWKSSSQPLRMIHNRKDISSPFPNNSIKFFLEYRNLYFMAVHTAYNSVMHNQTQFSRKSLAGFICKQAFVPSLKNKYAKSIIQQLISYGGTIKNYSLFKPLENSEHLLNLNSPFLEDSDSKNARRDLPFLLTTIEKRQLRTLLEIPIFSYLVGQNLKDKLINLLNVKPFPFEDVIVNRNFRSDGDELNDNLKKNLSFIMDTLEKNLLMNYCHSSASRQKFYGTCRPAQIIYSPYLRRFQLDAIILNKNFEEVSLKRMNIANLTELKKVRNICRNSISINEWRNRQRVKEPLRLAIKSIRGFHDIERCFMLFSTHEKTAWYNEEENIYYMNISFHTFEISTLLRKILSLGASVVVLSPDSIREAILRRIQI